MWNTLVSELLRNLVKYASHPLTRYRTYREELQCVPVIFQSSSSGRVVELLFRSKFLERSVTNGGINIGTSNESFESFQWLISKASCCRGTCCMDADGCQEAEEKSCHDSVHDSGLSISIDSIVMCLSHFWGGDVYPRGQQGISTVGGWCDLLEESRWCSLFPLCSSRGRNL